MLTPTKNTLLDTIAEMQSDLTDLRELFDRVQARVTTLQHSLESQVTDDAPILGDGITGKAAVLAANAYNIPVTLVYSRARDNRSVFPRQLAMFLARECGLSFPAIAAHFDVDHGTVMHACAKVKERMELNDTFRGTAEGCLTKLRPSSPFVKTSPDSLSSKS